MYGIADRSRTFFEYSVGLRQGEIISPLMFSVFLEDLELFLQDQVGSGIELDELALILLLFADDMAIIGKSPEELQHSLDLLHEYCGKWGLEVNTDKTKIVVFRKRGRTRDNETWLYDGTNIDVVNDFSYLGVVLNYTGSFVLNNLTLSGKGLKALHVLLINIRKHNVPPKYMGQLFDAFVSSTLNYACEIWGYSKSKELERIHLKFCKTILGVKTSTSNAGIYGELGRFPLYIQRYTRIVKYWGKLLSTDNCILHAIYQAAVTQANAGKCNWVSRCKALLYSFGFGEIWENQQFINHNAFVTEFKQRVTDCFLQKWREDIHSNSVMIFYKHIKVNFEYENYLDIVHNTQLRKCLTRIRLGSHGLRIETGRYGRNRIERNQRICTLCDSGEIEDAYHFVIICPFLNHFRSKYIARYYRQRPSVFKFTSLLATHHKKTIVNLCKYLKDAFEFRKTAIL